MSLDEYYDIIKKLGYTPTGFGGIYGNKYGDKIRISIKYNGQVTFEQVDEKKKQILP